MNKYLSKRSLIKLLFIPTKTGFFFFLFLVNVSLLKSAILNFT